MKSIPNILSCIRLIATPITVYFLIHGDWISALICHVLGGATDGLDGWMARRYGFASRLGSILDAAADKIYTLSLFWALTSLGRCPVIYLALIVTIALVQLVAFLWVRLDSRSLLAINSNRLGKWGLGLQFVWACVLIVNASSNSNSLTPIVFGLLAIIHTGSLVQYFIKHRAKLPMLEWFKTESNAP